MYKCLLLFILGAGSLFAQQKETYNSPKELYDQLIALDKAVFDAFNNCDTELLQDYFTTNAEFFHDRGGRTLTAVNIAASVKNNICGNPGLKVRRELVTETVQVFRMDNYGGIITGEHLFYQTVNDTEKLTGKAKFTHLCEFKDNRWKIHRVLSYDHRGIE